MGTTSDASTPRRDGFRMPAEWEPHEACLMEWPTRTREELWGDRFEEAMLDYAAVANAIAAFEPVVMVCDPDQQHDARRHCADGVEILPLPIDDSWMRDNGPIFVRDEGGRVALVHFGFNAWGEKFHPYDRDAEVPRHLASHLGMRRYEAPFVLEGGSFFVDGEGTLLTTEQCLLHPNRNPRLTRDEIEDGLREYLGAETIVWLGNGHSTDRDTDGHIDGIAIYVAPATVALLAPTDPGDPDHASGRENRERLEAARDARGRAFEVIPFETTRPGAVPYLNVYLPNGGAIVPTAGRPEDGEALERIAKLFPDREVVPVPGSVLTFGGGGPHCITQQLPRGVPVPAQMGLSPTEEDRLRVFTTAELARRTLERGLPLNGPEATALICDEMHMAARSGATFEGVAAAGRAAVRSDQLLPGVAELLEEIRLEVLLDEGTRLVVLRRPWT